MQIQTQEAKLTFIPQGEAYIPHRRPGVRSPWSMLKGIIALVRLIRDLKKLDTVLQLSDSVIDRNTLLGIAENLEVQAQNNEQITHALLEMPRLKLRPIQEMALLPEGTLGKIFADLMIQRGLNPYDLPRHTALDSVDYIRAHLFETHDLWHVLTGFDTDEAGELGLQAFYLAQLPVPLSFILLGVGLMNTGLFALQEREKRMNAILEGWTKGKKAKAFFGLPWDQHWETPLTQLQEIYRVQS